MINKNYYIGLAVGAFMAIGVSMSLGEYASKPVSAYVQDINNDGRQDIVFQRRDGKKQAFIQMQDGTYIPFKGNLEAKTQGEQSK